MVLVKCEQEGWLATANRTRVITRDTKSFVHGRCRPLKYLPLVTMQNLVAVYHTMCV